MSKTTFDKNGTFTLKAIAGSLMIRYPGYFKNLDACIATIGPYVRKKGIKPANEQKAWRVFSGVDAQRIYDHEAAIIEKKGKKPTTYRTCQREKEAEEMTAASPVSHKRIVEGMAEGTPFTKAIDDAINGRAQITFDDILAKPATDHEKADYFAYKAKEFCNYSDDAFDKKTFMECLRDILLAEV